MNLFKWIKKKNKICPVCEEEVHCEYFLEYDHEACCSCDDTSDVSKYCSDCFSSYASNMYDMLKDEKERAM